MTGSLNVVLTCTEIVSGTINPFGVTRIVIRSVEASAVIPLLIKFLIILNS